MRFRTLLAALAVAAVPALGSAQHARPIELGVDAGFTTTTDDPRVTAISIPVQMLRVGFYLTDRIALEPAFAFNWADSDVATGSSFEGELGVVYDVTHDRRAPQFFVRPLVAFSRESIEIQHLGHTDKETASQFGFGAGVGVKLPSRLSDRLSWRLEGMVQRMLENDDDGLPARTAVGVRAGISFFTR